MRKELHSGEGITGAGSTGFIDYMSITLPEEVNLANEVEKLFRVPFENFFRTSSGRSGYCTRYEYDNIDLLTDGGSLGMGHNITLKGTACHKYQQWLPQIAEHVFSIGGHFTRCDLAIDEYQCLLDLEAIKQSIKSGLVLANFKSVKEFNQYERKTGMVTGRGAYFGSRKSEVYIRIYDKALEQGVDQHWLRVELELKGSKADAAMKMVQHQEVGAVARGVLSDRISFRESGTGVNRSRWPVAPWWELFLDSVEKLKLVSDSRVRATQEDRLLWFIGNAATFAELVDRCGPGIIPVLYSKGKQKLEKRGGQVQWAA